MTAARRPNLVMLAVYLVTALLYLMPLPLHFANSIPGDNGDSYPNLWPFWYYPHMLATGTGGFFFHKLLFYPEGIHLVFTSSSTIGATLMAPVALLVSPAAALNSWLALNLWLGGWFFFKFSRTLGFGKWASWLAGFTYQWMPFNAAHIPGHYTLAQITFTAIALFSLAVLARRCAGEEFKSPATWKQLFWPAAGLSLACWAVAVSDFYLAIMTVYLLITLLAYFALHSRFRLAVRRPVFWTAIIAGAVFTLLLLVPWVLAIQAARAGHDYSPLDPYVVSKNISNWTRLISIPGWHPLWQRLVFPDLKGVVGVFNEWPYLGMVGFFFAALGLLFVRPLRLTIPWIVAFVIALGLGSGNRYSYLHGDAGGFITFGRYWPAVFPFAEFRVPGRWQFALCVILSITLALSVDALLNLPRHAAVPRRRQVIAFGISLLVAFDLVRWPLPLCPAEPLPAGIPPASEGATGTVLDIPVGMTSGMGHYLGQFVPETLRRQMAHERPVLSVNVSRLPNDVINDLKRDPELTAFFSVQSGSFLATPSYADEMTTAAIKPDPDLLLNDIITSSALNWPAFQRRYNFTTVRIPDDFETSTSLRTLLDCTAPGRWQWHLSDHELIGSLR
jgi:hypothetical protein